MVQVFIGLAVFCTFGLQFYVCLDIAWNAIRDNFTKRPQLVNYTMRTVLVTAAVLLAIVVPTIAPFIGLIGAFCFSILGLLVPVSNFIQNDVEEQNFNYPPFCCRSLLKWSPIGTTDSANSIGSSGRIFWSSFSDLARCFSEHNLQSGIFWLYTHLLLLLH